MSSPATRLGAVFGEEIRHSVSRPLYWILVIVLAFACWGLSEGDVTIASGDTSVGGTKAWITSQFANGQLQSMIVLIFYLFFIAVAAGMAVIRDEELGVGEILHATPLRPGEYLWGKFLAILSVFTGILGLHLAFSMFFNHALHAGEEAEQIGPLVLSNYLVPALVFSLPVLFFATGTSFAIGERTRKPILVFVLPVAIMLFCGFFLWDWSPGWLDPRWNRVLQWLDPAGFRWLNETWLKVDRGVDFYNTQPIGWDAPFLLSRLAFVALGLGSVAWAGRGFGRRLRGSAPGKRRAKLAAPGPAAGVPDSLAAADAVRRPLAALGMSARPPHFLTALRQVAGAEFRELRSHPGLYLFVPLILIQAVGNAFLDTGPFGMRVLVTSGFYAAHTMNTLTLLVSLLILFYLVESLVREKNTRVAPIVHATPVPTAALLMGKILANSLVAVVILGAALLGGVASVLAQGRFGVELKPYLLLWGCLLVPSYLLWGSFVAAVFSLTGNRFTTYGVGLGALALTGYLQMTGKMNWVGNWDLWSTVVWSDMGPLQLDRHAFVLNRLLALALALFLLRVAVRSFPRRDPDGLRVFSRLRPAPLARAGLALLPFALPPIVLGSVLGMDVRHGVQGKAIERKAHDYWKQNYVTWKDAPLPALTAVELDVTLDPPAGRFHTEGVYHFVNQLDKPLARFPLTGSLQWDEVSWTMNGAEYEPEDRSRLYVFTPGSPLQPGDSLTVGFTVSGKRPSGITKNGGEMMEFILPSGVVLTNFSATFTPVVGFMDDIGVKDENRLEPREYPDDFYLGRTKAAFGQGMMYTTSIRIHGPAGYTYNSVGTLVEDEVEDGTRTVLWRSDHPVRFFNIVAGRWDVRRGEGTAIYYHPGHGVNVAEMGDALDAARRWYSQWFAPFPWKELKLSEFPGYATYAQGFPTDITFSERIGFLARSDPHSNAAFAITAHESAHQWWANILMPGEGPGGNILSEGMAHFSTILLLDQAKGVRQRIEFCKRIEENYGDKRQVDSERPLVKIDETRAGDQTVVYDKGGWVFWMLLNRMGREAALAGCRDFIDRYWRGPDYPVLQDFVAVMREHAADKEAFDAFTDQWFFDVVVPEYKVREAKKRRLGAAEEGTAPGAGEAAAASVPAASDSAAWEARALVENVGTGTMTVQVAALRNERFTDDAVAPDYRDARVEVTLGAGESKEVVIPCDFEPDRIVVDPDALVLQLLRENAIARF